MTRTSFFLIMIIAMTIVGCGGGNGGGQVPNSPPIDLRLVATQAAKAAQSTPAQGSVTQTSNALNGITVDTISSTLSLNGNSLQATVRNGATTLGSSDITENPFSFSRSVCQSCGTRPSGTSSQWRQVSLKKEDSNGDVFAIVFSDIESNDDLDYLSAGIWAYVPEEASDSGDFDSVVYGTFTEGNAPFRADLVQGLTGEATYEGDAMGLYTEQTSDTFEGGLFDATVELTADFGTPSDTGTIRGSVTGFSGTNDATNQPFSFGGISLNLGETSIGNTRAGFFTGNTSGSHQGETYSGKWGGEFLGNGSSPTSVTGTFGAENGDSSNRRTFMGVFGAYEQ